MAEEIYRVSKVLDPSLPPAQALAREYWPERAWCIDGLFDYRDPVSRVNAILRFNGDNTALLQAVWRGDRNVTLTSGSVSSWAVHEGAFTEALTDRGTASRRCTYNATDSTLRGLPTVSANGTSQYLMASSAGFSTYPLYVRVLAKYGVDEGTAFSSALRYYTYARVSSPPIGTDYQGCGSGAPIMTLSGGNTTPGTWYDTEFLWEDGSPAVATVRHAGLTASGNLNTTVSSNPASMFGRTNGASTCDFLLNATIYQVIVMNLAPNAALQSALNSRTRILTNGIAVLPS